MTAANHYRLLLDDIKNISLNCHRDPLDIRLIAVSKGCSWDQMKPVYDAGCRDFGENRLLEALQKMEIAPKDIRWHFIGNLQKNKVRKVVECFALIHSVDSLELAEKISQVSQELSVVTSILLQVNTSGEFSKNGFNPKDCLELFGKIVHMSALNVCGLMTMAPNINDSSIIRHTFFSLKELKESIIQKFNPGPTFTYLSMGMSHDYRIAIEEGSNLLRVGSKIWHPESLNK